MGCVRVGERQRPFRLGVSVCVTAVLLLGSFCASAGAQVNRKQKRPRHETNASREARIARTIQNTYSHRWEVSGGGGYLRWRSGESTKRNNEVSWSVNTDYYLTPKLGIVAAAQGSFGRAYQQLPLQFAQIARPQINEYFFTGGANYRFYARERFVLGVQGSAGTAWGIFSSGAKGLTGPQVGLWHDGFRPAGTVSLNADYNLYPNLAFRVSPTYAVTDFQYTPQALLLEDPVATPIYHSAVQNNFGFNLSIVYRFGRLK